MLSKIAHAPNHHVVEFLKAHRDPNVRKAGERFEDVAAQVEDFACDVVNHERLADSSKKENARLHKRIAALAARNTELEKEIIE